MFERERERALSCLVLGAVLRWLHKQDKLGSYSVDSNDFRVLHACLIISAKVGKYCGSKERGTFLAIFLPYV